MKRIPFLLAVVLFALLLGACSRVAESSDAAVAVNEAEAPIESEPAEPETAEAPEQEVDQNAEAAAETEIYDSAATIKFVSNLQPGLPAPIPPKKVQLDWLIHGAGGEDIAGRT
ncbi:MAG: hypothetical protein FWB97_04890, partial [Oscillospiraceae bacterium]|nr:hypothetical protein [Oscillospiraceae bacterium]